MNAPIPLEEAWARLAAMIGPMAAESVAVDDGVGRVLARALVARRTQPHADLSAMDGFACHDAGPWNVVGEARAGAPFAAAISKGEAVRISTGAALPDGADRILVVEDAAIEGSRLMTTQEPAPGEHIRRRGFDFREGDALLDAGERIGPAALALARASGNGILHVHRPPTVAVIECGDELVADPQSCPPDRLPASNGAMLAAMARSVGAEVTRLGPVPDTPEALHEAFAAARGAELIVTSGGASVGEHDLVRPVLEEMGAEIAFWRVAIRPGKPLLIGRLGTAIVLGLPGNPVSSFVTGQLFMLPAIRGLSGDHNPHPTAVPIPLGADLPAGGNRREFRRARLADGRAQPIAERDSSALLALARADLLIDRPADSPEAKAGTPVPCYWLGNGETLDLSHGVAYLFHIRSQPCPQGGPCE